MTVLVTQCPGCGVRVGGSGIRATFPPIAVAKDSGFKIVMGCLLSWHSTGAGACRFSEVVVPLDAITTVKVAD